MSLRYKAVLIFVILVVSSTVGFLLLYINQNSLQRQYVKVTQNNLRAQVAKESSEISAFFMGMEKVVIGTAAAGESFLRLSAAGSEAAEQGLRKYTGEIIGKHKDLAGGGIWFEPYAFSPDRQNIGPYAYWNQGKVVLTDEYEDPAANFHNESWYLTALPKGWNRSTRREKPVYWTPPYEDAVTKVLMTSVTCPMYDGTGKIVGITTLDVGLGNMAEMTRKMLPTPSSRSFIVDNASGLIIAFPQNPDLLLRPVEKMGAIGARLANAATDRPVEFEQTESGRNWLVFYQVGATGIGFGIAVPDDEIFARANSLHATGNWTILIAVVVMLGVALVAFVVQEKGIVRPVRQLASAAQKIAEGDLETPIGTGYNAEIGQLGKSLQQMVNSLVYSLNEAKEMAEASKAQTEKAQIAMREAEEAKGQAERARHEGTLAAVASLEQIIGRISSSSEELAAHIVHTNEGANQQSAKSAAAATAMEEMNITVLEVAQNAGQASEASASARHKAAIGAQVVQKAIGGIHVVQQQSLKLKSTMEELGENAQAVSQIMGVISDIADQTNLLALNAAIEAARAGDAGRGFAVVADEVRKLAEKTMASTTEVGRAVSAIQSSAGESTAQVEASSKSIEEATSLVNQSGVALTEIVQMVDTMTDQVRIIATAAEEQSATSEEINHSISNVSGIAAETAQAMQEASQAISNLTSQSRILEKLIEDMKANK